MKGYTIIICGNTNRNLWRLPEWVEKERVEDEMVLFSQSRGVVIFWFVLHRLKMTFLFRM